MELQGLFDESNLLEVIKDFGRKWYYYDNQNLVIEGHNIMTLPIYEKIIAISKNGRYLLSTHNMCSRDIEDRIDPDESFIVRTLNLENYDIKVARIQKIKAKYVNIVNAIIDDNILYCVEDRRLIIHNIETSTTYEKMLKSNMKNVIYDLGCYICYGVQNENFSIIIVNQEGSVILNKIFQNVLNYYLYNKKFYIIREGKVNHEILSINFEGQISFVVELQLPIPEEIKFEIIEGDLDLNIKHYDNDINLKLHITNKYIIINDTYNEESKIFNSKTGEFITEIYDIQLSKDNHPEYLIGTTDDEIKVYTNIEPLQYISIHNIPGRTWDCVTGFIQTI
jgi:hypothetical protein